MLARLLTPLALVIADRLADRLLNQLDDIAAAIAREVVAGVAPKLPDLSDLDDQLVQRLVPDINQLINTIDGLSGQVVNEVLAAIRNMLPGFLR